MTIMPALAAWAVVPFGPEVALANVNAGLLFLMAITSLEVYGVIIAGWASNSKYAFLGALRASAQMVSYEIAMGFALVVVLMAAGSMNMTEIVPAAGPRHGGQQGDTTSCRGTGCRCCRCSSCISSPGLPRRIAHLSTSSKANRKSWRVFHVEYSVWRLPCSSLPNT